MANEPVTLGQLIAQGSVQAADTQPAKAGASQPIAPSTDMRASEPAKHETESAVAVGGEVTGAATSATPGIPQSAGADAIERVRRRVADETQAMHRAFSTPWNGR